MKQTRKSRRFLVDKLFAAASFCLLALSGTAQTYGGGQLPRQKTSSTNLSESATDFRQKYPAVKMELPTQHSNSLEPVLTRPRLLPQMPRKIISSTPASLLYGNAYASNDWSYYSPQYGMYSITTSQPATSSLLGLNSDMVASGGGAIYDGVFHFINFSNSWFGAEATYYEVSTDDWTTVTKREELSDFSIVALETAYDPTNNKIFGEFYNSSLNGYEFGYVDYESRSRTTIASTDLVFVALGITNDGKAYGIATDGNLYRIDTKTGETTLVGSTGVKIAYDSWGDYSGQSGEIDPNNNIFYWAATDSLRARNLYTVDLKTAQLTNLGSLSESYYCLTVPAPDAEDGAPAAATDISFSFPKGSLTGAINFTAPSKTFGGSDLSGELTYYVLSNGDTIATGTTVAGQQTTANVAFTEGGQKNIAVVTANGVGSSPKAKATVWIGADTPVAPDNVALNINTENGTATITWDAPTTGIHNGYIDTDNLTYIIVDLQTNDTLSTSATGTSYTVSGLTSELKAYRYSVTAVSDTMRSEAATTDKIVAGNSLETPYYEDFSSQSDFDLYTVIDANGDGSTWEYDDYYHWVSTRFTQGTADDWLITPAIHLLPGRFYELSVRARTEMSYYPEPIAIAMGTGTNPSTYTEVLPATDMSNTYKLIKTNVTVDTEGNYHFGFHDINTEGKHGLYIDSVSVVEGALQTVPDSVSDLTVVPAEKGALSATISFMAPTETADGSARLDKLTSVDVYRDDSVLVHSFENPVPGSQLSCVDDGMTDGTHTYSVKASNANGTSFAASQTVYVGQDVPVSPSMTLTDNGNNTLTGRWSQAEAGAAGHYVNADDVHYSLYNIKNDGTVSDTIATNVKGNSYDFTRDTESGDQTLAYYGLQARNRVGNGEIALGYAVVGAPYSLPFRESFANTELGHWFWHNGVGSTAVTPIVYSYDNDKGSIRMASYGQGAENVLSTGKISLAGAKHPHLNFRYRYPSQSVSSQLRVEINVATQYTDTVFTKNLREVDADEWSFADIDLSKYKDARYIMIGFRTVQQTAGSVNTELDAMNIIDVNDNDLNVSMTAPEVAQAGIDGTVDVNVENFGLTDVADYKVRLYANDSVVSTVNGENLKYMEKKTFAMPFRPFVTSGDSISLYAEVVCSADDNDENNISPVSKVKVLSDYLPAISDLSGDVSKDSLKLSWSSPSQEPLQVTEDFESYAPWQTQYLNDWTLVDGDKGMTGGYTMGGYPKQNTPFAYIVYNPKDHDDNMETFPAYEAHSGDQYLASFYTFDKYGERIITADDWLISPRLSGNSQTLQFYARGFQDSEHYQVLYSTTGRDTADFHLVLDSMTVNSSWRQSGWDEVNLDVPEGTKFFAIHALTTGFAFMLDDISFEKAAPGGNVEGYNIYRDGKLLATVPATETSFAITEGDDENHIYNVTTIYEDGESPLSNSWTGMLPTGIDKIVIDETNPKDVYTVGGILMRRQAKSLDGLAKGVYIIGGKTVTVK